MEGVSGMSYELWYCVEILLDHTQRNLGAWCSGNVILFNEGWKRLQFIIKSYILL